MGRFDGVQIVIERTATMNSAELPAEPDPRVEALEHRVVRLEDAVAQLQDTQPIEERVAERVADRIGRNRSHPGRETTGIIIEAGRHLLPAVLTSVRDQNSASEPPTAKPSLNWTGLLWELLVELRAIFCMFVDPRYRLGWPTRILTVLLLAAIATSRFWPPMSMLPDMMAAILDKIVDLGLSYVLWKVLIHEARRYRQTAPELPPSMRL
ncbi:MAG TPA: hypothetical protein VGG61_10975 [Gemmataceae bacterium]